MKQQRLLLGKWQSSSGVMRPTFDDLEKPFYNRGIVEIVDFLWDFERNCELKKWNNNVKRNRVVLYVSKSQRPWMRKMIKMCDTWYSLKKAMIKGVVEVEEKINKVWRIRQRDDKSILMYTYRYEALVAPVKRMIKDKYWYISGYVKIDVERKEIIGLNVNKVVEIEKMEIERKNIPEVEIEKDDKTFVCHQQLAEMGNNIAINSLDRHCQNEIGIDDKALGDERNMTYDLLNMYLDDNENCKYAIDEKYHNRPDDVKHSSGLIVEERNRWLDDLETEINIDNSIRLLMFWSNLVSFILNSYLRQVCGQSNKADVRVKGIEGDIKTLDIDGKLNESGKYVDDYEFLQSKRVDNSMMKHQIDIMMNTNFDNIRLKATEYYKIDEMDTWEVLHQRKTTVNYASLDHDQEVGVINRNFIGNINYDRCIINGKGFERNHKPNRGDVNFDNKVHGV
ncbi:hypothetical protein C2G38_2154693 [Gigaspora rosea]|uniref:Uncharacterized protein n=1 Tax=Gigaspora rosea TaxID=44941 RepID=A0A397W4J5_9GLOM|nr:hypothetical protein C2G38_2154693 [Gigaspora rosea]